ncbi:MAG: Flp pilus assembly complex ATPase component TadA [Phycisphaeraceae bacterium]|nr:Flp pilus assembly complex ATPase component TadA [Phycisphaeraceae bacterium]
MTRSTGQLDSTFDARAAVDRLIDQAAARSASDLHIEPTAGDCELRLRIDGLLEVVQHVSTADGRAMVSRLMVMAQLLTYRLDVPQEGRITALAPTLGKALDLRLAIMPTTHGLRAAVRLPAELSQPRQLDQLHLPPLTLAGLQRFINASSGMLILTGPAGSGKTTTIYALMQQILRTSPGLSIISLEDPVERDLPGVTQIEVRPFGELTYDKALRSILRQDPQVLALGEIRDPATAAIAAQAAMAGHRLICTLHAATPGSAVVRLLDMGLEPYQLTSSLFAVVAQRLLRRSDGKGGYAGRLPIASCAVVSESLREAILQRAAAQKIDSLLAESGEYQTLEQAAAQLVEQGLTDEPEVARVLGR